MRVLCPNKEGFTFNNMTLYIAFNGVSARARAVLPNKKVRTVPGLMHHIITLSAYFLICHLPKAMDQAPLSSETINNQVRDSTGKGERFDFVLHHQHCRDKMTTNPDAISWVERN
jgi:hypothetical protein